MLTIRGGGSRFCDGVSRRNFLRIGALGLGGLTLPQLLRARGRSREWASRAQGGHHDLPARRAAAPGHVRPEAGRAGRDPRRVQADQDQRPGHRDLRACCRSSRRMMDKLVLDPLDRRRDGRPRLVPVPDRPRQRRTCRPAAGPSLGSVVSQAAGPGRPGDPAVRRPLAEDAAHARTTPGKPGFLGVGPRAVPARRRGQGRHGAQRRHARPARRPPGAARRASTASAATSTPAA